MSYRLLVFQPDIKNHPKPENVLWKGQVIPPSNYKSIMLVLLQDLIELNNRRTLSQWQEILNENQFNYELNYDHEYCIEYIIEDQSCVAYSFQLFKCDLQDGVDKIEITNDYILPMFYTLDIKPDRSYNPVSILKRIEAGLELISVSRPEPSNLIMIGQLNLLKKLAEICINYEVDIKCTIEVRA
jgi:hypothetical protein